MSPLFLAVSHGQYESCKFVLEHGVDPNLRGSYGQCIFALIIANQYPAILKLGLDHDIDVNTRDARGSSVLGRTILIDYRDEIMVGDIELKRVVDSLSTAKLEIMKILVEKGVDINGRELDCATALHAAAVVGAIEAVKILLNASVDPNVVDLGNHRLLWMVL